MLVLPHFTCLDNTCFPDKGNREKLPKGSEVPYIGLLGGSVIFNVSMAEIKCSSLQNNKNNKYM